MEHVAKVVSIGESLDIIKDVGGAHDVDDTYAIDGFDGTHGIGHVRLATESDVTPDASHPFWATGFADVAIVHNGQITNYWKMRRRLEKRGFEFGTDNDSELIAVYLADKLAQGDPARRRARVLDPRSRRHVLLPGLDEGRDRLREGPARGEADGHVRGRRARRDRIRRGLAEQALPGEAATHDGAAAGHVPDLETILSAVETARAVIEPTENGPYRVDKLRRLANSRGRADRARGDGLAVPVRRLAEQAVLRRDTS